MVRKKNRNLNKAEPSIPELNKELTSEEVVEIAKKYDFDCTGYDYKASGSDLCYEDYSTVSYTHLTLPTMIRV